MSACGDNAADAPVFVGRATSSAEPTPTLKALPSPANRDSGGAIAQTIITPLPTAAPRPEESLVVQLDPGADGLPISPYIYGMAGTDPKDPGYAAGLRLPFLRWGGSQATRFNWALGNAWNTGRDGGFRNTGNGAPGKDLASELVENSLKNNIALLITIPTIGWVAKNSDSSIFSADVPQSGGPPLFPGADAIKGYDPAANRALTSVKSAARKNAPFVVKPDPNSPVVYQDEWVASLVARFGPASKGGVKFYAMDNEPDIWSQTQTDVHPAQVSYDELLARFTEYASAVKDVDPSAMITGPVSWGWQGYFNSELDRGEDNFATAADQAKHSGVPLLPWFLDQMKQYEQKNGKRLLDVLDIHYYPQATGIYSGLTDAKSNELRLRATRSLWDSNYVDESWIRTPVQLIPRMREWINKYYPGTKLGISEWNFGADDTLNGGLAISQALGVFGREGLYLASYWRNPPSGSPGYYAFKMYTNFDDKGSSFGDKSLPVKLSGGQQKVSAYAALDSKSGRARLVLVNTQPDKEQKISVLFPKALSQQQANLYQLSAQAGNKLAALPPLDLPAGSRFELVVPAYSATLIDFQP